jgi:hypothetical protein
MKVTWPMRALTVLPFASPALPLALALLTNNALAADWVVDDNGGPGVDFTSVAAAVAAANHTDVILVRPGVYTGFTTSKGVTVIADVGAQLEPGQSMTIQGLASFRTFTVSGLNTRSVFVEDCAGKVIIEGMPTTVSREITVTNSDDVRIARVRLEGNPALAIQNSTVEVSASTIIGFDGFDGVHGFNGDPAAVVDLGSSVRFMLCDMWGGDGGSCPLFGGCGGGSGAPAVDVDGGSSIVITGNDTTTIGGGSGGDGGGYSGFSSKAIVLKDNSNARISGVFAFGGIDFQVTAYGGSSSEIPVPADPVLTLSGTPAGGNFLTLTAHGPPNSNVRIWLGRTPIQQYTGGSVIEPVLVQPLRAIPAGQTNAQGELEYTFVIPPNLAPGFLVLAQAELVQLGGQTNRTASVPMPLH